MLKFMFMLTVWTADSHAPQVYIEDVLLSGSDCIALMEAYHAADPTYERGTPSCEIDHGLPDAEITHNGQTYILPPCHTEDSRNCYWDAAYMGNGAGRSFYDIDGQAFALD